MFNSEYYTRKSKQTSKNLYFGPYLLVEDSNDIAEYTLIIV